MALHNKNSWRISKAWAPILPGADAAQGDQRPMWGSFSVGLGHRPCHNHVMYFLILSVLSLSSRVSSLVRSFTCPRVSDFYILFPIFILNSVEVTLNTKLLATIAQERGYKCNRRAVLTVPASSARQRACPEPAWIETIVYSLVFSQPTLRQGHICAQIVSEGLKTQPKRASADFVRQRDY